MRNALLIWIVLGAGWVSYGIWVAPHGLTWMVSALLMILSTGRMTARWARDGWEAYWIFVAFISLQLGTLATLSSLLGRLEPAVWLCLQGMGTLGVFVRWPWRTDRGFSLKGLVQALAVGWRIRPGRECLTGLLMSGLLVWVGWMGYLMYITPLYNYDARSCHASRVLYWIQNKSIFHFTTSNVRQTAFPLGSEMYFLWGVLLTRDERVGRMVAWTGFPLALGGLYGLIRALGTGRAVALLGAILWGVTPIVTAHVTTLKPDMHFALFLEGMAFWTLRAWQDRASPGFRRCLGWAGLLGALAVNTRWNGLFVLGIPFLIPILAPRRPWVDRVRAYGALALGLGSGAVLSGLSVTLVENLVDYGHPLGPAPMRWVHAGEWSLHRFYLHTVRFPFLLLELPYWPESRSRTSVEGAVRQVIHSLKADAPLPLEENWVGRFTFRFPEYGEKFSAGGLLWGLALILGTVHLVRSAVARTIDPISLLVLMELSAVWGTVWAIRWMSKAGVPERLLIGPYGLGLSICAYFLHRWALSVRAPAFLTVSLLAWTVYGTLHAPEVVRPDRVRTLAALRWEPFQEVLRHVPPGSRILLVAHESTRDYALFDPLHRYSNKVVRWGLHPFDASRLETEICRYRINFVVLHDDGMTAPRGLIQGVPQAVEAYLRGRPEVHRIPLSWDGIRLYHLEGNGWSCSFSASP